MHSLTNTILQSLSSVWPWRNGVFLWFVTQPLHMLEVTSYQNWCFLTSHYESTLTFCKLFVYSLFQEGVKTENNEHINLKVAGQDGSVVQFKIKRHTPLSKLMKAYCERQVRLQHDNLFIFWLFGILEGSIGCQTGNQGFSWINHNWLYIIAHHIR